MELKTAASVISYISKIEQESADFYEKLSKEYEIHTDMFLSFVKENKKNEKNIRRTYYSVVTDALETGFSFKGLHTDVKVPSLNSGIQRDVLRASIELEKRIQETASLSYIEQQAEERLGMKKLENEIIYIQPHYFATTQRVSD